MLHYYRVYPIIEPTKGKGPFKIYREEVAMERISLEVRVGSWTVRISVWRRKSTETRTR